MTGQKEAHVENDGALAQETPKPQRERIGRKRTVQTNVRNTLTEPIEEISYIPRDSHSLRGQQFTERNTNQLDLTSYMQLPSVEQDSKICGKCGEQGHMKRHCTADVACDFCKTKSHSTLACRTYANFVKEHPLTSSRKNTPEKFCNELDVNMEVAKRVEMELCKWQREHERKGKAPLSQLRKQQMMNSQQHSIQETPYSQDVRVQLGERVHTELHQPQQQRYHQAKKVNHRFIAEDKRHSRRGLQGRDSITSDPHGYHSAIKANNHFIMYDTRYQRKITQDESERGPTAFDPQQFQPTIKANNLFFTEEGRNYVRSPVYKGEEISLPRQQSFQPAINANNHLVEKNLEYHDKRTNQLYGFSAATEVQAANEERINRNTAEKYTTRSPQREPSHMERIQNERVPTYVENNADYTENMMREHGQ